MSRRRQASEREALARRAAGGDLEAARRLVGMLEQERRRSEEPEMSSSSASRELTDAVQLMIDRAFPSIPQSWAALAAEHLDDAQPDMPAWGWVWRVKDSAFESRIRDLLRPVGPGTVEEADEAVEEGSLGVDRDDYVDDDDGDLDEDAYVEAVRETWLERAMDRGNDMAILGHVGWQRVGDTGFLAREIDGNLVLGIHGAGYGFMDEHWIPLYRALELRWHERD